MLPFLLILQTNWMFITIQNILHAINDDVANILGMYLCLCWKNY